jgi:asparagine synthetase B (glutamine-hydrolysing)
MGWDAVHDGPLSLATRPGAVEVAEAGGCRVWLAGRLEPPDLFDDLPPPAAGPADPADAARAAATAFDRLGYAAQAHLHGAYVLVVRDRTRGLLRVSHDHLGARTLSYARRGSDTFFAEHIVDLLTLLPGTPAPDRLAVVQWIDRRSLPLTRTLFSGVARLGAGEALEISATGVTVKDYWRPAYREPGRMSREDAAEAIVGAAFAAVRRAAEGLQLPALKLSGGLDSTCVAAGLAAARDGRRTMAFARTFPEYPETDEASLIEQTARMTRHELIALPYADTPLFPAVRDYIHRWMQPPGSPHIAIWQPLMASARASGVDGMLDGEGGDEMFGMSPYLIADRLRHGRVLDAWRRAAEIPGMGPHPDPRLHRRALRMYGIGGAIPRPVQLLRRRMRDPRGRFGPLVRESDIPGLVAQEDPWSAKPRSGPLWWRYLVDELLDGRERLDASGEMARDSVDIGIDRRHPFVHDARLVEAVLAIPPALQFDAVRDRPLLRDGLAGAVPESVRTRYRKSFFTDVSVHALTGPEGVELLAHLSSAAAPIREFVSADGLEALGAISSADGRPRQRLAASLFGAAGVDAWLRELHGRE